MVINYENPEKRVVTDMPEEQYLRERFLPKAVADKLYAMCVKLSDPYFTESSFDVMAESFQAYYRYNDCESTGIHRTTLCYSAHAESEKQACIQVFQELLLHDWPRLRHRAALLTQAFETNERV